MSTEVSQLVEQACYRARLGWQLRETLVKHFNELLAADVHQVSAPVEISSCATCGHPVESGGERPAERSAVDALRELVNLKDIKRALKVVAPDDWTAFEDAAEADYNRRKPLAWDAARAVLRTEAFNALFRGGQRTVRAERVR